MLRFAPSPTGDMHIGNLRVALLNYILAKQTNKKFLIRIEDTDTKRNVEDMDKNILQILNIFNIDYNDVVYQSNNLKYHRQIAFKLLDNKKAFNCFCNTNQLQNDKAKAKKNKTPYRYSGACESIDGNINIDNENAFSVRIKKPLNDINFNDIIKGDFSIKPYNIDSFVILRTDKTPTYNFACSVDDMLYDIDTIIRGEDHLSNTPKQIHIHQALNYNNKIKYIHIPMILDSNSGKKLSKRDKNSNVKSLLKQGFLPSAIANYLLLLGYSTNNIQDTPHNKNNKEIFNLAQAIEFYDVAKISKSNAKFDIKKLEFINNEHLKLLSNLKLASLMDYKDSNIGQLAKIYLEESNTLNELKAKIDNYFKPREILQEFKVEQKTINEIIKKLVKDNFYVSSDNKDNKELLDNFNKFKNYLQNTSGLKGVNLLKPLRYILTNSLNGPNLSDIYPLIKKHLKDILC
jgi:glutamyl-tRNA synthetase